jgi:hypothetical protein
VITFILLAGYNPFDDPSTPLVVAKVRRCEVSACVRACVRPCVRVCAGVCVCVWCVCMCCHPQRQEVRSP